MSSATGQPAPARVQPESPCCSAPLEPCWSPRAVVRAQQEGSMGTATKTGFAAMIACAPCDPATEATARAFVQEIRSNVDAWYTDEISHAEMRARVERRRRIPLR